MGDLVNKGFYDGMGFSVVTGLWSRLAIRRGRPRGMWEHPLKVSGLARMGSDSSHLRSSLLMIRDHSTRRPLRMKVGVVRQPSFHSLVMEPWDGHVKNMTPIAVAVNFFGFCSTLT